MTPSKWLALVCCVAAFALSGQTAFGHNLFVLLKPQAEGPDQIDVIFEHSPKPGDGEYNKPLLTRGKTWVITPGRNKLPLVKLKEIVQSGKKFLRGETKAKRPRAVVHSVTWGIYRGRLDFFHGKYLDVSSPAELELLARTERLPLDLVPAAAQDSLSVQVLFKGKPLAKKRLSVWAPNGQILKPTTDAAGRITLKRPAAGRYCFTVYHTLKNESGEYEGKPYKGMMHGSSCTMVYPVK